MVQGVWGGGCRGRGRGDGVGVGVGVGVWGRGVVLGRWRMFLCYACNKICNMSFATCIII